MAREIRISIDDDEVFERMKRRKTALDLSWEEVLKRGLERRENVNIDLGRFGGIQVSDDPWESREPRSPQGPTGVPGPDFGEELGRRIREQVQRSLGFEEEVADLSDAEDAILVIDSDDPGAQVPLRVNLLTTADGLDVDVVAIRQGKSVADLNSFPAGARRQLVEALANGETFSLQIGPDEAYDVRPELSWGRDENGNPTVTEVSIDEVVF